jgi:uncharacterized repeat protein (TIGR01451 family)
MKTYGARSFAFARLSFALLAGLALWLLTVSSASAVQLTINVVGVGPNGSTVAAPTEYRWTVEQDATKLSIPGQPATSANYSFSFHTSYMPVVAAGRRCNGGLCTVPTAQADDPDVARLYSQALPNLDNTKRYFVSIAAEGFQMGGAPVVFSGSGTTATATATVYLNQYPVPPAQISIFVFNDNNPINGAPDLPVENGLAGFHVRLIEAGGTYGQSGGEVTQDAFGNPLGTTYSDDQGTVLQRGSGIIRTNADGVALIKNLFPAKYTILVNPPAGTDWHQTSTIEGTKGIDAWVKNNEPSFFQEFGPPGHHVFVGFTRSGVLVPGVLNGTKTLTGRIVNTHHSRPPVFTFYPGAPVTECWVGLNEPLGGRALYAAPCNKDGTFSIPNVPNGTWELAIWDEPLDMIIAATTVTVTAASNADLGDLPVSSWFGRYQGRVFQDIDGTGLPYFAEAFDRPYIYVNPITGVEEERQQAFAAGELKPSFGAGIANNLRFRDGSIYQSTTTKDDGTFAFTEVFPFFNWLVAEIDYARFKATSANVVVDDGGPIDPAANKSKLWPAAKGQFASNDPALAYDPWTRINPQLQAPGDCPQGRTAPCYFRTESVEGGPGAILLEGIQTFLGATNHIEWGKTPYKLTENGGIAGIVYYAITRAEDDPRFAAAENWEPGIPRVQVNVFLDCDADGKPDKPNNDGSGLCSQLSGSGYAYDKPDVDNFPFCWRDPGSLGCPAGSTPFKGLEDVKRSRIGAANEFSYGDVFRWGSSDPGSQYIGLGKTDSWDDSVPTGCPDVTPYSVPSTGEPLDCFDGLRNYNQVRPSVFDGGFAFGRVAGQAELPMIIGAEGKGTYILEAVAPPGYLHQGNGDKNVVFGDTLKATPAALPHECVGQTLPVPPELTLFPGEPNPNYAPGATWNKCDMKAVPLVPGLNAAPNFYMYTEASVAGHGVGFILDDTATEFNYLAPNFGEKYAPPHLPVSVRDWTGREITRVYSDQFGSYNFLLPSTFTVNPPYPSGVMPSMMVACMNHPGPIADPNDPTKQVIDPFYNRAYSTFCYTFQYLPGKTTYLDTPVLPIGAFASVTTNPLDCECEDGTPAIHSVNHGLDDGPRVPLAGGTLTIVSRGLVDVTNPAFNPAVVLQATCPITPPLDPLCTTDANDPRLKKTIQRDYGFGGTPGTVTVGGTPLTVAAGAWSAGLITATVPSGLPASGQLMIKRGDNGKESIVGITVHRTAAVPRKVNPNGTDSPTCGGATPCKTIQAAIDAASAGDLITVAPGTYHEYVIMDKRVRLQGWGAGAVTINAVKSNSSDLAAWRTKINARANNSFTLLPGQALGINAANNEPALFGAEEGPGILVVGRRGAGATNNTGLLTDCGLLEALVPLSIDGLTVTGGDSGGGILASGYACGLEVSNNRVVGNYGTYGGGIRVGHTTLSAVQGGVEAYTDGVNRRANLHHNWVSQNGATAAGGGGGITLGTGSDSYEVTSNYVCGNFSMADGGGLSHLGRSPQHTLPLIGTTPVNRIADNTFIFNQTFNQGGDPMGGGVSIAGQVPLTPAGATPGTGDVAMNANLLQGNQAGAGAGGGVSIARTASGDDIVLTNNMVINNVAAYTGGGVALSNTVAGVRLVNNTVASNASTATNRQAANPLGWAFPSLPQVAGISVLSGTSPTLLNNIVWANRSYVYVIAGAASGLFNPGTTVTPGATPTDPPVIVPNATVSYRDFGRVAGAGSLAPTYSVLTGPGTGYVVVNDNVTVSATNVTEVADSTTLFVKPDRFASITDPSQPFVFQDATVNLQGALTFDETGNFINVIFSPLTLWEISGANVGALRADYHIAGASVARDRGLAPAAGNFVPTSDFDGQARVLPTDVGADEYSAPPADLSITKTDGVASINQGGSVTYTIVVANAGPNAVTGATVTDTMPASLTGVAWTCTATAGSTCPASGSGNIAASVDLANGGSATFTVSATLSATATGNLVNTATVAAPASVSDPNALNNSSTDTDLIVVPKPTLAVLDGFNRANATTLGGNWSQATLFGAAALRVNANQAFANSAGNAYWNVPTGGFGGKQGAAFTFANATLNGDGLILKASGAVTLGVAQNFIRVRTTATQVIVETTTNTGLSFTQRGAFNATFATGDTLTAMVDASGVAYVWKTSGTTDTLLGSAATTFAGTGRIGMQLPVNARVDNFAGGTVP